MTRTHITCPHGVRWHLACPACAAAQAQADKRAQAKAERLAQAHALLDAYRAGANFSARRVNAALAATGDLCASINPATAAQAAQA